jgi:hypothetical protein
MGFPDSAHRGFGNLDPTIAVQVIHNPQGSKFVLRPEFQNFLNDFRRCPAGMAIGDGSFSIQARLASFLVLLFPTVKA